MWLGLSLFYVGAVLFLNGLWMLGKIADKEIWVINIFTGVVSLCIGLASIFGPAADAASVKSGADPAVRLHLSLGGFQSLQRRRRPGSGLVQPVRGGHRRSRRPRYADQRQLGAGLVDGRQLGRLGRALGLVLRAAGPEKSIERPTGWLCIAQGVLTGWVPGYLILAGKLM
jgi:hypothetical protein